jgi:hypothetical protein
MRVDNPVYAGVDSIAERGGGKLKVTTYQDKTDAAKYKRENYPNLRLQIIVATSEEAYTIAPWAIVI